MKQTNYGTKDDHFRKMINRFSLSSIGFWEIKPNGEMFFYNTNFYEQLNIYDEKLMLNDWLDKKHDDDQDDFLAYINEFKKTFEKGTFEYRIKNKNGKVLWIESNMYSIKDENGTLLSIIGTHHDITLHKDYEHKLYNEAYVDKLTQLHNANKLIVDIEKDLVDDIEGTILFLDFSHINHMLTVYGQTFIDKLILEIYKIFEGIFSDIFDIYRFIPFVFSFKTNMNVDEKQVQTLCNKMEQEIRQLYLKMNLSSEVVYNAVMMLYPQEEYFHSCEDMFNRIFLTLEEVSNQVGTLTVYTNETKDRIKRKMFIETNLIKALDDSEFYCEFQPILSSSGDELFGFEALARWTNSKWGPIYPDEFIDVSEQSGAIVKLGKYVLDSACSFISKYNEKYDTDLTISVNSSVKELLNPDYFDFIRNTLGKYNLKPSNLIIEITESLILDDNDYILNQLHHLKEEGVGIAIDDFGTGYSSINTLFTTPITEMKIDREVMLKLDQYPIIFDFISSLVDLCHKNKITVVAEGIEDENMLSKTLELNIDYVQGYKFSRPLTLDDAINYTGK
jgi:PAS domain S-box-containing protein